MNCPVILYQTVIIKCIYVSFTMKHKYKTLVLLYDVCWLSNNSDNYDSIILLHALAHLYCA